MDARIKIQEEKGPEGIELYTKGLERHVSFTSYDMIRSNSVAGKGQGEIGLFTSHLVLDVDFSRYNCTNA